MHSPDVDAEPSLWKHFRNVASACGYLCFLAATVSYSGGRSFWPTLVALAATALVMSIIALLLIAQCVS